MIRGNLCRALVAAACLLTAPAAFGGGGGVTLTVVPSATMVEPNETFTVDVVASGLGDMTSPSIGGYDLVLAFDDAVFTFTGLAFGSDLGAGSFQESMQSGGDLNAAEVSILTPADLNAAQPGTFTLFTATFQATGGGDGAFDLMVIEIADENGAPLPVDALMGATVSAGTLLDIPTLSPLGFLLLMTLLGLAGARVLRQRRAVR